jgi:deoxyhypusine synthase
MNDSKKNQPETVMHSGLELEPVRSLDLAQVGSFSDLLTAMKATSFAGRQLGEAADILHDMVADEDCYVVGTFSGAMTVAKQGLILCDMIENGMIQAIVSTGALMCHGFVEAAGMAHYKYRADLDDDELYKAGFDRVYDTLELEQNLDDTEIIVRQVLAEWPEDEVASSRTISRELGRWLAENTDGRGILRSAFEHDVPVYVPAFSDSELGLDFAITNRLRKKSNRVPIAFDPFLDLEHYTAQISGQKTTGIFTIGGGVPRNWAQQVGPFLDIINKRGAAIDETPGVLHRFRSAVRICPEPVHWGGLSGCTYSEGVSWGKFVPVAEGGRFAEVAADATVVWPLLIAGVLERLGRR